MNYYDDQFKAIVLGALFHDIGKFYQRSDPEVNYRESSVLDHDTKKNIGFICPSGSKGYSHKHALWTFQFLKRIDKNINSIIKNSLKLKDDNVLNLASLHHKPSTPLQYLIQFADRLSSGMERASEQDELAENEDSKFRFRTVRLKPIFELVSFSESEVPESNYKYNIRAFDLQKENIFPQNVETIRPELGESLDKEYQKLWLEFERDFEKISSQNFYFYVDSLLSLMEKYTWCIPSSTSERPDISLYDHLKTTAGIASCIYKYYESKDDFSRDSILNREDEKFLLLGGDLSGIQKYIFDLAHVNLRKVSKTLRARSFYLTALPKIIVTKILYENDLTPANILMESGGRFILLLPNTEKIKKYLDTFFVKLNEWCLNEFYGELTVGLDWSVTLNGHDFFEQGFRDKYELLIDRLEAKKFQKFHFKTRMRWEETGFVIGKDYEKLRQDDTSLCEACQKKPIDHFQIKVTEEDEEIKLCKNCFQLRKIGQELTKATFISIEANKGNFDKKLPHFEFNFDKVTFRFVLHNNTKKIKDLIKSAPFITGFQLTSENFLKDEFYPVFHVANYVARFSEDVEHYKNYYRKNKIGGETDWIEKGSIKTFSDLAIPDNQLSNPEDTKGAHFLAIFKADVDNLGVIFGKGLKENLTISRYATLSRMMNAFFAGYLDKFLEKNYPDTYTVYAGGDDVFLIGNWKEIVHFAPHFNQEFREYTCWNPDIHLSAGIELIKSRSPILRGARLAEEALDKSKRKVDSDGKVRKNKVTVFGTSIEWNEWAKLQEWFEFFDQKLQQSKDENRIYSLTKINSAFLYRLLKYREMAESYFNNGDVKGLLFLSHLSYDIKRNIEMSIEKNPDIKRELKMLQRLMDVKNKEIRKIHIPIFYAFYNNRGG